MSGPAPDPAASAAEPAPRARRVLASGHLHPAVLVLKLVDALRQAALPLVIAFVAKASALAIAVAVLALVGLVFAIARYVSFRYELDADELVTREGILQRQERRIPVDRIQDLSFESTLLRRMLGLVVVSVETASGQGAEARLDSLGRREGAMLREVLLRLRDPAQPGEATRASPAAGGRILERTALGELVLLGLTSNRAGAILVAVVGFFEFADELGVGAAIGGSVGASLERLSAFGAPIVALFLVGIAILVFVLGAVLSIAARLLRWGDFELSLRGDVLGRRHGWITRRAQSLPKRRIQRVLLEANPLRRLVDRVVLRADSAGADANEQDASRSARDVMVPLCASRRAERLVPELLDGLATARPVWRRVSSRLILRLSAEGLVAGSIAAALLFPRFGWPAMLLLLLPVFTFGWATLAWHNLGFARLPGHVAFRWGVLSRTRAFVPLRKLQGVTLVAGPIDRLFGLARITVYVAGGSPTRLGHLPREEARALRDAVVAEAEALDFVW
ncbi:MAG: PH domain-containing protein [Planctomycetes bacterium]|nr:PH domain-containing protein [Planctomycetota bacterium]